jgi:RimJ/RimL family protein N-acetyltransferase
MNIITIDNSNSNLIYEFLKNTSSEHFRYYNKRKPEDVINNHSYTIISTIEKEDNIEYICYGHIDVSIESNNEKKYWLGICVSDNYRNKKYGTVILNKLLEWCKNNINIIYLSVDIDNSIAINMYLKHGFFIDIINNDVIYMKKLTSQYNTLKLDVSYSESLDKLSILEIKLNNINDERKTHVLTEYEILKNQLNHIYNDDIQYFYNILKSINLNIWILQDKFRISQDKTEKNRLCEEIILENDRRFKVKSKINNYLNSTIKEQKGYVKNKAFLLTHLGLGDLINCIGMIRYLSTIYDKVVVVCKTKFYDNIKLFFNNDNSIVFYLCEDDRYISPNFGFEIEKFKQIVNGYDVFLCGHHKNSNFHNTKNDHPFFVPFRFYLDCNMDVSIFREYCYIPKLIESKKLYNEVININKNYIVVHESTSSGSLFKWNEIIHNLNINEILVINIDRNIYDKEHKFYYIAQKCIMKPVLYYSYLIENSMLNLLSDSCVFCLAIQLNIKTKYNYYIGRGTYPYLFTSEYGFDSNKHPFFKTS